MRRVGGAALAVMLATASPAAPRASDWRITPDGLGPVRIGMTRAEVTRAVGSPLRGEELTEGCIEMEAARGWPGTSFMFEDGRVTRISIHSGSRARTPRGIAIGAGEAEVQRAYGSRLEREVHTYVGRPALYLTYWTVPERKGVRFETNERRRVETIHAGGASIAYIEGCL